MICSFIVTLRFFREQSPTLSWAFCFLQFTEPWHLPGLFRFRLRHARSSKPGVLLELIYYEARHIGGPLLFLEPGNDRSSKT